MGKLIPIDYEYNHSKDLHVNLVSCSMIDDDTRSFWLYNDDSTKLRLKNHIQDLHDKGHTFLAYNVIAEARSFMALGLDPLKFRWIDLYLEYRQLCNHNHSYMYGRQLKKGKKKFTVCPKPKWERTEEDEKDADNAKPEYNMGAAIYKSLGIVIDNDFKTATRDLIISAPDSFSNFEQADIMTYCESDVEYLIPMFNAFISEYKRLLGRNFDAKLLKKEMGIRAEYACRTAKMETIGYGINYDAVKAFSSQVGNIIWECQHDINSQFESPFFTANVKKRPFELSWKQKHTREVLKKWMAENNYKNWVLTKGGESGIKQLSLSLKAFTKPLSFSHSYPRGNFLAQMQRYLKLKQQLNGFTSNDSEETSTSKKKFWDSVGSDKRVRPYMSIYGAQSSRSQPSATAFIPLKSAWMRVMLEAPKGRAYCGIDYASQEYLIAALLSGDKNMLEAYRSGDVYLAYAKAAKMVPQDATKSSHKKQRDFCKPIVLGQQFDLTKYGLSVQLTEKTGKLVTPDQAQIWIDKHKRAYSTLWRYKDKVTLDYKIKKHIKLADGWTMWGDNANFRSVGNVPIQGLAAVIMRKAVALAQDAGLDVCLTLHDAVYIEYGSDKTSKTLELFAECMHNAFVHYFGNKVEADMIRLDADIWSKDFDKDTKYFDIPYTSVTGRKHIMPVKQQYKYIDERGIEEYEKFKHYLSVEEENYENITF